MARINELIREMGFELVNAIIDPRIDEDLQKTYDKGHKDGIESYKLQLVKEGLRPVLNEYGEKAFIIEVNKSDYFITADEIRELVDIHLYNLRGE